MRDIIEIFYSFERPIDAIMCGISATASMGGAHPKCPISHYSRAQIRLNLTDGMGYVGFEDRCGLWLIPTKLRLNKTPQEKI